LSDCTTAVCRATVAMEVLQDKYFSEFTGMWGCDLLLKPPHRYQETTDKQERYHDREEQDYSKTFPEGMWCFLLLELSFF